MDTMDIIQTFYDDLADHYDKLFQDWQMTTREQADLLDGLFRAQGFNRTARILDCACGIGTQAIGLAKLGYPVTASDISEGELAQARERARKNQAQLRFERADFCALGNAFPEKFEIIIAMDNALPHMLTGAALKTAVHSITDRLEEGGIFVASIRDYDTLLQTKPSYSPPYIHRTQKGQRVSFQTWSWEEDRYKLIQYIIEDEERPEVSRFECEYRAVTRAELTSLLGSCGCREVVWKFPEETGFYQPIVIARK